MSGSSSSPSKCAAIQAGIEAPQAAANLLHLGEIGDRQDAGHDRHARCRRRARGRESAGTDSASKKNCVIARLAPASILRFRLSRSAPALARLGMGLGIGGDADLEIARRASARRRDRRHRHSRRDAARSARRSPAGRSRRAARRYGGCRPPNRARATASISSRVAATQVRCAAGSSAVSWRMRRTVAWVRSRVEPPAP